MRYLIQILLSFFGRKDTPVLMAGNTIGNSGKIYAMAAMMPFAMVPVDDTPLFSYALAHKSVNSSYTMTASNNDDVSMALMNGDPYTSKEQKQRDLYEINDTDWYSVSFEGDQTVSDEGRKSSDTKSLDSAGTATNWIAASTKSVCHLAMHSDWMQSKGYVTDGVVNMNLPEQGISGPFKITSIKHITPQKKPVDEDPNVYPDPCIGNEYEYRPVTGLFTHQSNDVWKITFDNGETLGVTNNHPIYSVSKGDWQHAGHLEIGEEVLAKGGNTKVVSKERDQALQPVYNLEVKDLHNFLVSESGLVVHNNCFNIVKKRLEDLKVGNLHLLRKAPDNKVRITGPNSNKVNEKFPNARRNGNDLEVCYDDLGFPDFSDFIPQYNGQPLSFEINMTGDGSDMTEARSKLNALLGTQFSTNAKINIPGYEGVEWTFHHHQDGKTMQLVPFVINDEAKHIGGSAISKKGGNLNFPGPDQISKYKTGCN